MVLSMITLGKVQDFSADELVLLQQDNAIVNKALLDPKFIAILMAATYENTNDDNATIVKNITAAITVSTMSCEDLGWWATHRSHTIAEEDVDGSITVNRPLYDAQDQSARCNTILHEACHCAGYSHAYSTQYLSVPYQAGNLLEQYLEDQSPQVSA